MYAIHDAFKIDNETPDLTPYSFDFIPKRTRVLLIRPQSNDYAKDVLKLRNYIPVTIDVKSKLDVIEYIVDNYDIALVLTTDEWFDKFKHLNTNVQSETYSSLTRQSYNTHDEAVCWLTSGTTGMPKLAPFTEEMIEANSDNIIKAAQLTTSDRYLGLQPIWHSYGCNTVLACAKAGCNINVEPFNAFNVNKLFNRFKPTWYATVPAVHKIISEKVDYKGLRFIRSGTAPLSKDVHEKLSQKFNCPVQVIYGTAETGQNFANPINDTRIGSIGKPTGLTTKIVDGVLHIKGPTTKNEWVNTGDIVEVKDNYYYVLGRQSEQINKSGTKINPIVMEKEIKELANEDCIVFPVPDETYGEHYMIVSENEISKTIISQFKPKKYFVAEIPKNYMSKVSRRKLYEYYKEEGIL